MSLRILLVDDNRTFLTAVRQYLAMLPDTKVVGLAYDGPDALAQAKALQPDLVLLDIMMPHMNGLEVAARMQSWSPAPRILFLSLHDNASYRAAAAELGAVALVDKANFVAELMPIVARLAADLAAQQAAAPAPRPPSMTEITP